MDNTLSGVNSIGSHSSRISIRQIVKYALLALIFSSILLMSSGISWQQSFKLILAVFLQGTAGALLWESINRGRNIFLVELFGMGMALGTLLSLFSAQLFRTSVFGQFGWLVPFLIAIIIKILSFIFFKTTSTIFISNNTAKQVAKGILPIMVLILIQLSVWWRWHPLKWLGWQKFNGDIAYHESLSNSIAILGATDSYMLPGSSIRYHWFAHAWAGSLSNSLGIDPFIVLTRLLPTVAFVMAATIAYSWAKQLSQNSWIPVLAGSIMVMGPGSSIGSLVAIRSPSSAMSVGWTLAFSFLLIEIIEGRLKNKDSYLALALLSIGIVGGKATNGLVIALGIVVLLLTSRKHDREIRRRIWIVTAICLPSMFVTFQILISTNTTHSLHLGFFLGGFGSLLTVLPITIGIFRLYWRRGIVRDPILLYMSSVFIIGSLLSLFLVDQDGNQLYFLMGAVTICIVPSLIGLEKLLVNEKEESIINSILSIKKKEKITIGIVVILSGIVTFLLWSIFENQSSLAGKVGRTLSPFFLWTVSTLIAFVVSDSLSSKFRQSYSRLKFLIVAVLLTTLVASSSYIIGSLFNGPIYSRSPGLSGSGKSQATIPGSISYNYVLAGKWVQAYTKQKDLFFSNRQCIDSLQSTSNCIGLSLYASALTRRQFLVEGPPEGLRNETLALSESQILSIRFSINPNQRDWEKLINANVRWGWIERNISSQLYWGKFGSIAYLNSDIIILDLWGGVNQKDS